MVSTRSGATVSAPGLDYVSQQDGADQQPSSTRKRRSVGKPGIADQEGDVSDDGHQQLTQNKETDGAKSGHPTFHYEFGGPVGTLVNMLLLPVVVLGLFYVCGANSCLEGMKLASLPGQLRARLPRSVWEVLTPFGLQVVLGWLGFQVALDLILPGEVAQGVMLKTGERLQYKLNGHRALWVSLLIMGHGVPKFDESWQLVELGAFKLSSVYDHYVELAAAAVLVSFVLSAALFWAAHRPGVLKADPGSSGNSIYDFWMGRELNPRLGPLDLKFFCELRPGLIGWAMLNLGMACKQMELRGSVSWPMAMVVLFQGVYVWDGLFQERAILTTMDITTDGFGFMLVFGDLCWVPFIYSLQARYLVDHDPGMHPAFYTAVFVLHWLGYWIFRGANGEKDRFRREGPEHPSNRHLQWMQTERGTKLLISGWWGLARKINYTGDWIMGLCWCLCTGFGSVVPYFYAIYFAILLIHRAKRDDHACQAKYGAEWARYKRQVPSWFIPGVF